MRRTSVLILVAATATPALAHTGIGDHLHFAYADGFMHPLSGVDHLLAMIAVGIWASFVGGAARLLWPLAFVSAMAIGGAFGLAGVGLPFAEAAIVASMIGLGAAITFGLRLPLVAGSAICSAFAVAHGYAHGTELPAGGSAIGYVAGFLTATAALHVTGLAIGATSVKSPIITRVAGALIAAAGAALAFA